MFVFLPILSTGDLFVSFPWLKVRSINYMYPKCTTIYLAVRTIQFSRSSVTDDLLLVKLLISHVLQEKLHRNGFKANKQNKGTPRITEF